MSDVNQSDVPKNNLQPDGTPNTGMSEFKRISKSIDAFVNGQSEWSKRRREKKRFKRIEEINEGNDIVRTIVSDTTAPPQFTALTVTTADGMKRYAPGFTPNQAYSGRIIEKNGKYIIDDSTNDQGKESEAKNKIGITGLAPNGWWGNLLDAHISRISGQNDGPETQFRLSAPDKIGNRVSNPDPSRKPISTSSTPGQAEPFSKRDTLMMFNDLATDYFLHDTLIEGNAVFFDDEETVEALNNSKLKNFTSTGWENQDPVVYSFQIIIDALSSPLLNGSVEEFIDSYPVVSEIQSRRRVIYDFKQQFQKLFRTRGDIEYRENEIKLYEKEKEALYSDYNSTYLNKYANSANAQGSTLKRRGKKAYLAHYLTKIDGLHKLNESNLGETKNFLVDYQKDFIKLTFGEDVSGTMAALSHLYKLLYWSKPLGKGVIPENLLRFNCDIVVTEVRNFNRIRNAMSVSDKDTTKNIYKIQTIKDNVSRHIYSLKECQFYFNTPPHEDSIDNSNVKLYEGFEVNFDYKYSTLKFDKWVSDPNLYGRYVSYNGGAIWRLGTKMAYEARRRERAEEGGDTGSVIDYSVPRFYTKNSNSLGQDGVRQEFELFNYMHNNSVHYDEPFDDDSDFTGYSGGIIDVPADDEEDGVTQRVLKRLGKGVSRFGKKFKQGAKRMIKNTLLWPWKEAKMHAMVRKDLLQETLSRARLFLGGGGLDSEPVNVYVKPYAPISMGIFFDVRNDLFNYWGEEMTGILANAKQILNPFGHQLIEDLLPNGLKKSDAPSVWFNPLNIMLKKYSQLPSVLSEVISGSKYQEVLSQVENAFSTWGGGFFQKSLLKSVINLDDIIKSFKNSAENKFTSLKGGFFQNSLLEYNGSLESLLNSNAEMNKPIMEGVLAGLPIGPYIPIDPNIGFGGSLPQQVLAYKSLNDALNKNAIFKPSNEGDGTPGSYKPYDPNVGFGGKAVPQSSDNVKADGTLENILNKNANYKPTEEGVSKGQKSGNYKPYDYQEPKSGNNHGGTVPKGFGFSALGKQSVASDKTTEDTLNKNAEIKPKFETAISDATSPNINAILNKNAKFKPSDDGIGNGKYKPYDVNIGFGGSSVPFSGQGVVAQGDLDKILNSFAQFRPMDEGVSGGKITGKYKPYDANIGFGGGSVPGEQGVKSQGSLENIVKNNTQWPYPVNNKKFGL